MIIYYALSKRSSPGPSPKKLLKIPGPSPSKESPAPVANTSPGPSPSKESPAPVANTSPGPSPVGIQQACLPGYTRSSPAALDCNEILCTYQTYSPSGKIPCTQCPAGSTTNAYYGSTTCTATQQQCLPGYTRSSPSALDCNVPLCGVGTYSSTGKPPCTTCTPGFDLNAMYGATTCTFPNNPGCTVDQLFTATNPLDSTAGYACMSCPIGFMRSSPSSICDVQTPACASGTYSTSGRMDHSNTPCATCAANQIWNGSLCESCPSGQTAMNNYCVNPASLPSGGGGIVII